MASDPDQRAPDQRADMVAPAGGRARLVALAVSVLWLALVGVFGLFGGGFAEGGAMAGLLIAAVVAFPLALIWLAAEAARHVAQLRHETRRLADTLARMPAPDAGQTGHSGTLPADLEDKLTQLGTSARKTEAALSQLVSGQVVRAHGMSDGPSAPAPRPKPDRASPPASPPPSPPAQTPAQTPAQSSLPLEPGPETAPLARADFIRALNFPDSADDRAGFAALHRALEDRTAARLIQASQDVLTLLSQDGIYMDDLSPDRAHPDLWRRFARGERGGAIAALGGVRDRANLASLGARMREDTIFRDTAHHFLRRYDQMLEKLAEEASDQELAALSETRTSRAFMLLGRVAGAFDQG